MDAKQYCKLCDDRHVPGEHNTRDVTPRPWIREFLSGVPRSVAVATDKVADASRDNGSVATALRLPGEVKCPQCERMYVPVRKDARYCSPSCRKKAYRASRVKE